MSYHCPPWNLNLLHAAWPREAMTTVTTMIMKEKNMSRWMTQLAQVVVVVEVVEVVVALSSKKITTQ